MIFYDYHAHAENVAEIVAMAKKLGITGLCLTINWTNWAALEKFREAVEPHKKEMDIAIGIEIKDRPSKVVEIAQNYRKQVELILVHGGDLEVNRVVVETPEIDILLHPEHQREDSGMDHTMAKLAAKNNVAIEFGLNDLIYSYKLSRVRVLNSMVKNAKLVRKFKTPFVLTSGGWSPWNLRGASEMMSFGRYLGFSDPEIKKSVSGFILKENRKRLLGKWIMPGVEVLDNL